MSTETPPTDVEIAGASQNAAASTAANDDMAAITENPPVAPAASTTNAPEVASAEPIEVHPIEVHPAVKTLWGNFTGTFEEFKVWMEKELAKI